MLLVCGAHGLPVAAVRAGALDLHHVAASCVLFHQLQLQHCQPSTFVFPLGCCNEKHLGLHTPALAGTSPQPPRSFWMMRRSCAGQGLGDVAGYG